jgi:hypothetical protein
MSSEIIFIDTYLCPQCRAELEAGLDDWQGWRRCPACGLPSLPPQRARSPERGRYGVGSTADDQGDILVITDSPENRADADALVAPDNDRSSHVSAARLVFRTGLLVSAGLAFIFFLDRKTTNTIIFASLAVGFFLLLIRKPRRRPSES